MKNKITFTTAFNTYTTVSILGQGGSGIVYAVLDTSERPFALKRLNPNNINSDRLKRFKNEVFFCIKNTHPNIVTVIDFGFNEIGDTKCPFYVMPRHDKTLRDLINEKIHPEEALSYFTQILDGIEAAHLQDVWHRDLKPENILFNLNNDHLILTDFGIAHFSEVELKTLIETKEDDKLANFQYAAPEQRMRGSKTDHRADIFSLGLILNELFTNKLPLGTNWEKVEATAPDFRYLDPIVDKMLAQDPNHRHQSIDEVKADIEVSSKEHIARQRLSEISKKVVPLPEANDLFISNPVKVKDIDYQNGTLEIQLNQTINGEWLRAFTSFPCSAALHNYERERFAISGDKASIRLMSHSNESTVQQIVDQFKTWLMQTKNHLKSLREQSVERNQREELARLEERKKEEERRTNIISNTKI